MKKALYVIMIVAMAFAFAACGSGGSGDEGGSSGSPLAAVSAGDLNIEDFDWSVDEAKIDGEDCYALSLTNNSKYDLLGVQIDYELKSDVTDEQLSTFDGFMKEHSDYIDEGQTASEVMLRGDSVQLVPSGETVSDIPLVIGINDFTWTDIPSEEQFNLMEPKELLVGVIGSDDKLYLAYYDIADGDWKLDSETATLNEWPDIELANIVPKVEGHVFKSTEYDNINSMSLDVYGVGEDDFNAYVDKVKEAGFTEDPSEWESYYNAKDKDGNSISVDYNEYTKSFYISADGADKE